MGPIICVRVFGFLAVPLIYMTLNWLNYSQSGKAALLGAFAVLTVSTWSVGRGEDKKRGDFLWNLVVVFMFFSLMAVQAYLRDYFGVAADDEVVLEAAFNTDITESSEFMYQNLTGICKHIAVLLAFTFGYALLLHWGRKRMNKTEYRKKKSYASLTLFFGCIFIIIHLNSSMRKADPILYFPIRYYEWQKNLEKTKALQDQLSLTVNDPLLNSIHYAGSGPRTVVFLLGESTTRLNWSLYGYPRETTPELAALGDELLSFKDVIAGYPGTVGALRQIFTPADLTQPDLWKDKPDIFVIAKKAGYKIFWISNHGTDRSGLPSILGSHADVFEITNKGQSRSEGSLDDSLLSPLEAALDDPAPLKFIVVHMLGGHPAYDFRYPKAYARFNNVEDKVFYELKGQGRSPWAIMQRNYYDNAMLYTDCILREMVNSCRDRSNQPVACLFVPDHGEDVGHYTNFAGHNSKARSMFEIPLFFWCSKDFTVHQFDREKVKDRPYQTDTLDHTLLGLMKIEGAFYDSRHDLFSDEFLPATRMMSGVSYF